MDYNSRPTISVCASMNNEDRRIEKYIAALIGFADEIILSDTGSTDNTLAIAERVRGEHPDLIKIFHYKSEGSFHYGRAKNFAIEKASKDFVLVLDLDEVPSDKFKEEVRDFLRVKNPKVVKIVRKDECLPHLTERIERIIANGNNIFYGTSDADKVHEQFAHKYTTDTFIPPIWHRQGRDHWLNNPHYRLFYLQLEIERTPKTKSFFRHILRGIWMFWYKFKRVYWWQELYKDGVAGLRYACLRALYAFLIQFFVGLKAREIK